MTYIKQFDVWNSEKKLINDKVKKMEFSPGEIFWCNIGANIASEIDGKE